MRAPRVTASIQGLDEALVALGALDLRLHMVAPKALEAAGDTVADKWKSLVPVQDGNYKRAIGVEVHGTVGGADGDIAVRHLDNLVAHTAHPENEQPYLYAGRLEYGGPGTVTVYGGTQVAAVWRAFPSARPAVDSKREEAIAEASAILAATALVGTL